MNKHCTEIAELWGRAQQAQDPILRPEGLLSCHPPFWGPPWVEELLPPFCTHPSTHTPPVIHSLICPLIQ